MNVIAAASNIKGGNHPEYGTEDFLSIYPQFGSVDEAALTMMVETAVDNLPYDRWKNLWRVGVGLYTAHLLTLYLGAMPGEDANDAAIANKGKAVGLAASKTVDGVSITYDNSTTMGDLGGYAMWKSTVYGLQLATYARLLGHGGMVVP